MEQVAITPTVWAVYDHPIDYPDFFIARKFDVLPGGGRATNETHSSTSIDSIRKVLTSKGLYKHPRHCSDDPKILEVWV